MLIEDDIYFSMRNNNSYRLRKDKNKGGWYLTKAYDDQIETLLYTDSQMKSMLEENFIKS